jgi:hypothetical protein
LDVGLAALPIETVIDRDIAAIRQRQGRLAHDLRFAARHGRDRRVAARLKLELLEDFGKRAFGTIGVAFGQKEPVIETVIKQGSDDADQRDREQPERSAYLAAPMICLL